MNQEYAIRFRAMGCAGEVRLSPHADRESTAETVLRAIPTRLEAWEQMLSRFRPTSELSRVNRTAGSWTKVGRTLFDVVRQAKHAARLTAGLYNPLILPALVAQGYDRDFSLVSRPAAFPPPRIASWEAVELRSATAELRIPPDAALDLGGIGKGWAAHRLADDLEPFGACLVNLGGDIAARGAPQGQPGWQVEIGDPHSAQPLGAIFLRSGSIVTSGVDYRRWQTQDGEMRHHIIDPRTGLPAQTDVLSITVIHPEGAVAEAYAKAALILGGTSGLRWLDEQWATPGLVILLDGGVIATETMQTRLSFVIER